MSHRNRPEKKLERDILLALGKDPAVAIYTNPVGQGYYGTIYPQLRRLLQRTPYWGPVRELMVRSRVTYGLGVGSPDLIAIGYGGFFCGLELKAGSTLKPEQKQWHEAAFQRGARVDVVESVEDAWRVVT